MKEDLKKQIDLKQGQNGFIKVTDFPIDNLSDQQKIPLIRKANALFNEKKYEMAKRIYMTTGYSDGLTRIGDVYANDNNFLEALKMYLLAHNTRKSEPIVKDISKIISKILKQ